MTVYKLERILTMVYVEHGYLVSGLYPSSRNQITMTVYIRVIS
jgi:hypothetical protein